MAPKNSFGCGCWRLGECCCIFVVACCRLSWGLYHVHTTFCLVSAVFKCIMIHDIYIYIILQKGQQQIGWSRWLMPRKSMYFISKRDDSSCSPSEKLTVSQNFPSSWWNLWFTALHTSSLGMSLFAPWFFPPSPLQIVLHGGRHLRTHGRQQAVEDDVLLWEVQLAAQQLIGALARLHLAHWSTVPSWKWGVV